MANCHSCLFCFVSFHKSFSLKHKCSSAWARYEMCNIEYGRRMNMGILSGNPQDEPMHYGEVFGL
ncbi:hypothetical protein B4145_3821 [Bacillus subtilis]|uniref:Uncharacterized protein n=1 Tax=Bacillus subtilis subsp. subtilis TaxID=135461 RepID=A0ABD3ZT57_BACIU|nr:hypothetical protein B4067_3918 [Bacillus subtilis subsp. subtilis]KIN59410.1 hypothetical protein B4145_3821 [Bacillus subtilis]